MPLRTILPLFLLLLVSACAQQETITQNPLHQPASSTNTFPTLRQADTPKTPATAKVEPQQTSASVEAADVSTAPTSAGRPRASVTYKLRGSEAATESPEATPLTAAPALPPKDVWDRIRNGFAMTPIDNDLVHDWENWYSNRPDYVARMIDRSSRFLFHIVEEVEKRKMPMEVALLPMIESAYNPVAY